jgi:hypothetical protein
MTEAITKIQAPNLQTSASTPQNVTLENNVENLVAVPVSSASSTIAETIGPSVLGPPEASILAIKPCAITFFTTEELATKLQRDCKQNAITLTQQVEINNKSEDRFEIVGHYIPWILLIIIVVAARWLYIQAKAHATTHAKNSINNSEEIFKRILNTTPGIMLGLLGLTVTSMALGVALIAWYKYLGITDGFGQGSGSLVQAVWGSAATIAAAVVAIVLAHRSQKLSEETHDLERRAQKSEAERYAKEIKVQLRKVITPSLKSFALMCSRDTYPMSGVTIFFAAMMLTRIDKWSPVEDESIRQRLDPINEKDDERAELRDVYFRLRNARQASEGWNVDEEEIDEIIKAKFEGRPNYKEDFIQERERYFAEIMQEPDKNWLPCERLVRSWFDRESNRALLEGDVDEVIKLTKSIFEKSGESLQDVREKMRQDLLAICANTPGNFEKILHITKSILDNDAQTKKSLLITYIEQANVVPSLVKLHDKYRHIRNHFSTSLYELESLPYVMDVASRGSSYQALFNARKHIDKLDNLFSAWESDGKNSNDYYKWILTRYCLAQLVKTFIINSDPSSSEIIKKSRMLVDKEEIDRTYELGIYFWLIFMALPIDDQDLTVFTVRESFTFIDDLYLGLLPFKMNEVELATFFGFEELGEKSDPDQHLKRGNSILRYESPEQFSNTINLVGDIRDQLKRMISANKGLILNDIGLKHGGSWEFWHAVFRSALYPPEAMYSIRSQKAMPGWDVNGDD